MNANIRPFESFKVGDDNAIHLDEAFGKRTRFGGRVAHGALTFGFLAASQTRLIGAGIKGLKEAAV